MAAYKALILPSTNPKANRDGYLNVTAWTPVSINARESCLWKVRGIKFQGLPNSNDSFLAIMRLIENGSFDLLEENIFILAYIKKVPYVYKKKANQLFHQKQKGSKVCKTAA